jgi:hypothetical protein
MKAPLTAIIVSVLFVTLMAIGVYPHQVKADTADFISFNSGVTLFSPINTTYSSRFLTLNLTFGAGLGVKSSLNYNLDGKYEGPVSLVAKNPAELHVVNMMIGIVELPELSEGSHHLTVNVFSGIYDYHGANAPGAPFKPTTPGSADYVASWTHTVYFTVNSPSPPSTNTATMPAYSPTPFPSPSITPSPSHSPSPSLLPTPSLLTPSSSPSQQPGLDHSPTSENIQAENFTPSIIIFSLVMVAALIGILVYFIKIKK